MAIRKRKNAGKRRILPEFLPDRPQLTWTKSLYLTKGQRMQLLRWSLYTLLCVMLLVVQDVIMSRISIFGATTDLAVSVILLITVLHGSETGSVFVLIASCFYFFSGSAPGGYVIAIISFLGIGMALLRQMVWNRSLGSILFCSGVAMMAYEMIIFVIGLAMRLTHVGRVGVFALTGALSVLVMLPLYPLVYAIGKIGGKQWNE